ncbi:hypothetical protein L6R44_24210 [Enterobacter cloacae complex sp. ECC445]|uniref:hypothetical protein n=1 Tax=Enterobacteriaceae TaxID=543 RepID=UPI001F448B70|nr:MULTISPECIES: hypothetical protein [Enterobacteriaceae]MCG0459167.1 hypothetical protein [Enterobacter cloacae complex sp. ECC445]MDS4039348.1 hypothetical protein [Citrobacter amalonaticus]HED3078254.1 hypothetical protein [Citrobacter amalonaticus]HED3671752.1 hypothetical protein [Citrobacter amalonaticus]HED3697850.1 hypothetical protein [Citrobacter amalonaticus]
MKKGTTEIIERWSRLATEAKQLGLATIPIDPENMLMVLGELPASSAEKAADCQNDYQPAIDILRDRAARELDSGFRAHHNALIYAANELENAQAFGGE